MRIVKFEPEWDFQDVLMLPKSSDIPSRGRVDIIREMKMKHSSKIYTGTPVIAANMDTVGTMAMAEALAPHRMNVALHKHYTEAQLIDFFTKWKINHPNVPLFYSMGISDDDLVKFQKVNSAVPDGLEWICLDVANGYQQAFVSFLSSMRERCPDAVIMAGNVVTGETTERLIFAGADIVKVGIGPGSVCTTRWIAGVGRPQLSAVLECADAAHGLKGRVCSDGGCISPGDISKALGAGADFVMLGGMFAGHDECEGKRVTVDGREYLKFRGMSSREAMEDHYGGVAKHRAAEGKEVSIPYKGPVEETVQKIQGGIRSACTYMGAEKIKELSTRTSFVLVNRQTNNVFGEPPK